MTCFFVCIENRRIVESAKGLSLTSISDIAEEIACASSNVKNEFLGVGICDKAIVLVLVEDARFSLDMFCGKYMPECEHYHDMPQDAATFERSLKDVMERYTSIRFIPSVQTQQAIRVFANPTPAPAG